MSEFPKGPHSGSEAFEEVKRKFLAMQDRGKPTPLVERLEEEDGKELECVDPRWIRNLAARLGNVPAMYNVNQYDSDMLLALAAKLEKVGEVFAKHAEAIEKLTR